MKRLILSSVCILLIIPCIAFSQPPILPPLMQPDSVIVVPSAGADVYMVPGVEGLYFFKGSWFRLNDGYWYKSSAVSGRPWAPVGLSAVPNAIMAIPPSYISSMPPGYHRIPFNDFHRNWRPWGQSRYWGNHGWYREHRTNYWGGNAFHNPHDARRGWQGRYGHDGRHVRIDRGRVERSRAGHERVERNRVDHGRVERNRPERNRVERVGTGHGRPDPDDRGRR
jgi:hypothetical protein